MNIATSSQDPFHIDEQGLAGWSILTENISYKMHPETETSGIQVADSTLHCSIGGRPGLLPFSSYNERSPLPVEQHIPISNLLTL